MGINIKREDIENYKVTVIEPTPQGEPSIYDLKYLVYRLDLQKQFGLNDMETKLLSFILSFFQTSDKFYFGNQSLAKLFDKHTNTISSAISSLEKKGLIKCSREVMAGGGEIRFIQPTVNYEQGSQKTMSKAHRKLGENNNKINNNKINNILKDTNIPLKEYSLFLQRFNTILSTRYRGSDKVKRQFNARLRDGYTLDEILKAVENASKDEFLMGKNENHKKYLTPEYILRANILDKWLNAPIEGEGVKRAKL